jgi:cobalt-zinc-cadmium efflux system outer membrane protein
MTQIRSACWRVTTVAALVASALTSRAALADETARSASDDGVEVPRSAAQPDRPDAVPEGVVVPAHLTLAEATKLFRARGLDLLIADTTVDSAHGALLVARGFTNPAVSIGIGASLTYSPYVANGSGMSGPGLGGASTLTWNVNVTDQACLAQIVFGKHGLNVKVARWAYEAAKMDRQDAQRTLEGGMRQQFAQAALAKVSIARAKENNEFSSAIFTLVKNKYSRGAVSDAELAAAETDMLETEQAIALAQRSYYQSKVALAFLLGSRTIASEFDLEDDFLRNKISEALESPGARATLVKEAFDHRPDLKAVEYYRQSAIHAVRLAKRNRIPDIALWVNYTMEGTGNSAIQPPTLTGGLSAPIPIFYQQQGEIKQAEANLRREDVNRARREAQVANDLESARGAPVRQGPDGSARRAPAPPRPGLARSGEDPVRARRRLARGSPVRRAAVHPDGAGVRPGADGLLDRCLPARAGPRPGAPQVMLGWWDRGLLRSSADARRPGSSFMNSSALCSPIALALGALCFMWHPLGGGVAHARTGTGRATHFAPQSAGRPGGVAPVRGHAARVAPRKGVPSPIAFHGFVGVQPAGRGAARASFDSRASRLTPRVGALVPIDAHPIGPPSASPIHAPGRGPLAAGPRSIARGAAPPWSRSILPSVSISPMVQPRSSRR